jgi:hypothetical protein
MYGKFFASTFTGSMLGSGGDTFAVWGYAIANADRRGFVELNPRLLAAVIGSKPEAISSAISKLSAPDPESRTKKEDGRRIVREGSFIYRIVNHPAYLAIRDEDERRAYQREWAKAKRAKSLDAVDRRLTPVDRRRPPSTHVDKDKDKDKDKDSDPDLTNIGDLDPAGVRSNGHANNGADARDRTPRSDTFPFRPPLRAPRLGTITPAFLSVFEPYTNQARRIPASQVFLELAEDYPGGEAGLAAAIQAEYAKGLLKRHPYSSPEARYRPSFEKFLAERQWEDRESPAITNGTKTANALAEWWLESSEEK